MPQKRLTTREAVTFHEYETRMRVGVAFPRRLLRGRGDRRQEASWTPETVAGIEKVKNNQQEIQKNGQ